LLRAPHPTKNKIILQILQARIKKRLEIQYKLTKISKLPFIQ
jgi:hypothetical protein